MFLHIGLVHTSSQRITELQSQLAQITEEHENLSQRYREAKRGWDSTRSDAEGINGHPLSSKFSNK